MYKTFLRNHYGFYYRKNFQYWLSRIIPAAVLNPLPLLAGYFITIILHSKGEPFPAERIAPGLGLYFGMVALLAVALYVGFRVLDKKEHLKYSPVEA